MRPPWYTQKVPEHAGLCGEILSQRRRRRRGKRRRRKRRRSWGPQDITKGLSSRLETVTESGRDERGSYGEGSQWKFLGRIITMCYILAAASYCASPKHFAHAVQTGCLRDLQGLSPQL